MKIAWPTIDKYEANINYIAQNMRSPPLPTSQTYMFIDLY